MDRPGTDNKIGNLVVISRMGLFPLNLMDGLQCYSPRVGLGVRLIVQIQVCPARGKGGNGVGGILHACQA